MKLFKLSYPYLGQLGKFSLRSEKGKTYFHSRKILFLLNNSLKLNLISVLKETSTQDHKQKLDLFAVPFFFKSREIVSFFKKWLVSTYLRTVWVFCNTLNCLPDITNFSFYSINISLILSLAIRKS